MAKVKILARTETEIRRIVLDYFHNRYKSARSARSDKTGVAAKISVVYRGLKLSHELSQQEIRRSLTYLLSQGWVEEEQIVKNVPLKSGVVLPQPTSYYKITAAGIDKIEGPGEFTMPKFHGININAVNASGHNIITVGDGNQVDARHSPAASALADLRHAVVSSKSLSEDQKFEAVADVDTIQSQLAKTKPNASIVRAAWSGVEKMAVLAGLVANARKVAALLGALFTAPG